MSLTIKSNLPFGNQYSFDFKRNAPNVLEKWSLWYEEKSCFFYKEEKKRKSFTNSIMCWKNKNKNKNISSKWYNLCMWLKYLLIFIVYLFVCILFSWFVPWLRHVTPNTITIHQVRAQTKKKTKTNSVNTKF